MRVDVVQPFVRVLIIVVAHPGDRVQRNSRRVLRSTKEGSIEGARVVRRRWRSV